MDALVSLPGQTPSTRRVAPAPETRTLARETQGAKFSCDQLVVSQSLDGLEVEGCPVSLSSLDRKFAGEARADETGGYDEGHQGFREISNSFVCHATSSWFGS